VFDCPNFRSIFNFRLFEFCIFYANVLSIFIYVLLAKIYVKTKKPCTCGDDPFFNLVMRSNNDFLATDNFIMQSITLKLCDILISLFTVMFIYRDQKLKDPAIKYTITNFLTLLMWLYFVYVGTNYEKFFSRTKVILFCLINCVTFGIQIYDAYQLEISLI
jgi:hypothetical protein